MKFKTSIFTVLLFILGSVGFAQKPTSAPKAQDSPVDFSQPENIVLFIVLPIVIVILYFLWRRSKRQEKSE